MASIQYLLAPQTLMVYYTYEYEKPGIHPHN
jgi:hypothetical protein